MTKLRYTASERFWKMVQVSDIDTCWPWTGAKNGSDGYGYFRVQTYKGIGAHRFAYEAEYGPIPAGMVVRHTCDNPGCCNPKHLVLGTHSDNVADRVARSRSAVGERNGRARLTRQQVKEIRQRHASGETYASLATQYGVDPSTVGYAARGHSWK